MTTNEISLQFHFQAQELIFASETRLETLWWIRPRQISRPKLQSRPKPIKRPSHKKYDEEDSI